MVHLKVEHIIFVNFMSLFTLCKDNLKHVQLNHGTISESIVMHTQTPLYFLVAAEGRLTLHIPLIITFCKKQSSFCRAGFHFPCRQVFNGGVCVPAWEGGAIIPTNHFSLANKHICRNLECLSGQSTTHLVKGKRVYFTSNQTNRKVRIQIYCSCSSGFSAAHKTGVAFVAHLVKMQITHEGDVLGLKLAWALCCHFCLTLATFPASLP